MNFEKYGVSFRELEHKDIEMVRQWRNNSDVAQYMITRDHITTEMQERWFHGIRQRNELHFIIHYGGRDIGLYSVKDIDLENKAAELAMYLAVEDDRNSHVPFLITFCVSEIIQKLGLEKVWIVILDENKRAIRYNKFLGFKPTDQVKNGNVRLYWLDFDEHTRACEKLKKLLNLD